MNFFFTSIMSLTWSPPVYTLTGHWTAIQVCALIRDQTRNFSVHGMGWYSNQPSHWARAAVAHSLKLHSINFYEYTMIYFFSLKTMGIELLSVFCSFKQFWHEILIHDFRGRVYKIFFCFISVELVGHGAHTFHFNKVEISQVFGEIRGCIDFHCNWQFILSALLIYILIDAQHWHTFNFCYSRNVKCYLWF